MSEQEWFNKDFYEVLGVSKDTDDTAIRKACRKFARTQHPGKNPGGEKAETRFEEIGEAYSVLSNKEQRCKYGAIRFMASGGARFNVGGAGDPNLSDLFGGAFTGGGTRMNFDGGADFGDIPGGLFGASQPFTGTQGFGGGGFDPGRSGFVSSPFAGAQTPRPRKGEGRHALTSITFRKALAGTEIIMSIDSSKQKVRLSKDVKDGQEIRLREKSHPGVNGGAPGDLVITIHVSTHPVFTRDHDNLRIVLPVTFAEAILGAKIEVPLLDDSSVTVKIPAGTRSGVILHVQSRGAGASKTEGDLLIEVRVAVPKDLNDTQKAVLEGFIATPRDPDPRAELLTRAKVQTMAAQGNGAEGALAFVISAAAELAGMCPQTLCQYDRLGLVILARTKGRGRRYSKRGIQRLRDV